MPGWIKHAVWWHLYPLGFVGAEPQAPTTADTHHRLRHVQEWLDYAVELGASGLALGPVFASSTHGYDTIDYFQVDPRLGDDADFDSLIRSAHDRGLKVMLDGVFNHVGRSFPAFRAALARGPAAPEAEWFHITWPQDWAAGDEPDYATFEGHRRLVSLNHDTPAVTDYVARVMIHWLDRGADAWRLDAAYAVPARFWASVLPRVRTAHPGAYIMGEVIHGDYARIVHESGLDAVTQYELWKAIWSSLNDRNFFELAWALERHNRLLESFVPLTFLGNHDVTRIASRLNDALHLPHAIVILLTIGGTPSIYAGDEQAFRGIKENREGGDDAVRPMFPPTPEDLAPYGWSTYRLHQRLIGLRRRHSWLHTARVERTQIATDHITYESSHGGHWLTVALNIADRVTRHPVPGARRVEAGTAMLSGSGTPGAYADLRPGGWAVLLP